MNQARSPRAIWESLDVNGPPTVSWVRAVDESRIVVLLGAFDPPTNAHVAILRAAVRQEGCPGVLCLTKVLLARPGEELLDRIERLRLLDEIAPDEGFGLAVSNRGTYLEVSTAMSASGMRATFVVGSDKLVQLADPSFYADGAHGVRATFAQVDLLVIPRAGVDVTRGDVRLLDPRIVFTDADEADISATEVRRRVREGMDVSALVPRRVGLALGGYTAAK